MTVCDGSCIGVLFRCLHLFEMGAVQLNQMRAIPLLEMGQLLEMGAVQLFDMVALQLHDM